MKVLRINKFFRKFGEIQVRRRWFFIAAMLAVTVIGLSGLRKLVIRDNQADWFDENEKIKIATDRFEKAFGSEDIIGVLVRADDVFSPDVLRMIDAMGREMLQEIPFAKKVNSLTTLSLVTGSEDEIQIVKPFEDGIPDSTTEEGRRRLAEIKRFMLSRQSIVNKLISADATEAWIILQLYNYGDEKKNTDTARYYEVGDAAHKLLDDPKWQSDRWELFQAGGPYTECEERDVVNSEVTRNLLEGFVVMLVCLIVFVRSLRGLIVPMFTTVGGIGVVFGFMAYAGQIADSNMMTIPIILGMALAVGYSIHYINAFKLNFRMTGERKSSVIKAVEETGWPILFTALTTIASLISFILIDIGPLKWLGITASATVFTVFLYVIILIPVLLSFGKDKTPEQTATASYTPRIDRAFERFGRAVMTAKVPLIILGFLIIAAFIPGIPRIEVNMDYVKMFGTKIPYIARLAKLADMQLGTQYSYKVMIECAEPDVFKEPERMQALEQLEKALGRLSETRISNGTPRVQSALDLVREMNRMLNGDDPAFYTIPDERATLTEELFQYELSDSEYLFSWLSEDYASTYLSVDLRGYESAMITQNVAEAERLGKEFFPDAEVSVIGIIAEFADLNGKIVQGEIKSFGGSLFIIVLMLIIVFSSVRTGLIGMIPNVTPVIILSGLMGYLNFQLDMMTMTIIPMILGIAVDDTIHFINHTKYLYEISGNYKESIIRTYREVGKTMSMTTTIICAMFFVYTFSIMTTMQRIGILAIIGLFAALLADYLMTPVLILITKPFGRERLAVKK